MNKTNIKKRITRRLAPLMAVAALYTSSLNSNAQTTNQNSESGIYGGLNYNNSISVEAGYKTPRIGIAAFGEQGIAGIKAGIFDRTKADLDLTGALYLGDVQGASAHLGRDFLFKEKYNFKPEIGVGYFKAGDQDLVAGFGSFLAQRQLGKNWTLSAGIRAYTDENLTGNSVEGLLALSYGQKPRNSLTHISIPKGLEGRLSKELVLPVTEPAPEPTTTPTYTPRPTPTTPTNGDNGNDDDDDDDNGNGLPTGPGGGDTGGGSVGQ